MNTTFTHITNKIEELDTDGKELIESQDLASIASRFENAILATDENGTFLHAIFDSQEDLLAWLDQVLDFAKENNFSLFSDEPGKHFQGLYFEHGLRNVVLSGRYPDPIGAFEKAHNRQADYAVVGVRVKG